jgi:hypothetical protein
MSFLQARQSSVERKAELRYLFVVDRGSHEAWCFAKASQNMLALTALRQTSAGRTYPRATSTDLLLGLVH